jgi:hypothetical protein
MSPFIAPLVGTFVFAAVGTASAGTPSRAHLRLIAVTEREIRALRGADGQPTQQPATLTPRPGSYDALIRPIVMRNAEGIRATRPAAVSVPAVEAVRGARTAFLDTLPQRGSEIVLAVDDAAPRIWACVSPPVSTPARRPAAAPTGRGRRRVSLASRVPRRGRRW